MLMLEFFKSFLFGLVEGITEWLPISSTGHMILLDEFVKLKASPEFIEMFLVLIQLGAILAVLVLYWKKIFPFTQTKGKFSLNPGVLTLWIKIIIACIPAAVVGLLFDDFINHYLYTYQTVAIALIVFGILFLIIEDYNIKRTPRVDQLATLSYRDAFIIGIFQLVAAVFPGTSRSGATILGGIMIGLSRKVAADFTFVLAIPVMMGASLLKLVKFGFHFSSLEITLLFIGMISAFGVSLVVIRFLLSYIQKNDFKIFGWYRIILGILVLLYFGLFR